MSMRLLFVKESMAWPRSSGHDVHCYHLMRELAKIGRVIEREAPGFHRRNVLVLDATTGQNALSQAREFLGVVPIDGVLLAKLDGTAKGGVAVAVVRELGVPIRYLGVGESVEDLMGFDAGAFAEGLIGE